RAARARPHGQRDRCLRDRRGGDAPRSAERRARGRGRSAASDVRAGLVSVATSGGFIMAVTQSDKAARFRALHEGPGAFIIPNPWDAGSARILAGLGFQALATSSGASAGILGRRDGKVTREEALSQARGIVEATDLPVSADLEKGFGDAPNAA